MITLNTVYSNLQCPVKGGLPVIYESNGRNHLLLFPQIPDIMTDRNAEPAVASTCGAPLATPELSTQCTSVLSDDRQIEIEAFFDIVSMSTCTEAYIFWGILCRAKVNISICCSRLLNHSRKTTSSWEIDGHQIFILKNHSNIYQESLHCFLFFCHINIFLFLQLRQPVPSS